MVSLVAFTLRNIIGKAKLQTQKFNQLQMTNIVVDPSIGIQLEPRRFRKFTKQLATLGPASNTVEMIEKLFLSGETVTFPVKF